MAPRIELIYIDAGGGHRAATTALAAELRRSRAHWGVTTTNLQELLLRVDPIFRATRIKSQDIYNSALARGWTRTSRPFLRAMQTAIKLHAKVVEKELERHWTTSRPDMVVSLIPNFNGVMYRSLGAATPRTPYVTVMTDIADTPPHFWQEHQDQHLICGSEKAYRQARLTNWYRPERVHKVSGMILSPSFYEPPGQPAITRRDLGLEDEATTLLISFGGNGSAVSAVILDHLETAGADVQAIVLCGRSETLRKSLAGRPRCRAVAFTDRVADYMRIADVFIGKPGPGSISEALHKGLPVIVECNKRTLVQERYNATWLEERGVGIALESFSDIARALSYLSDSNVMTLYRSRAKGLRNRALFEIPDILDGILRNELPPDEVRRTVESSILSCDQ
jgi:1,2-diacylglycerol 3-beta-galactosyltransferase